ncbi:MAG: zinc ribbon domain-containing protein [Coprococcus sp.]
MKLSIAKIISVVLPIIGVLAIFAFAFTGHIVYGWSVFIILMLVSGVITTIFFRCPNCHRAIPANGTPNQKYCPYCHKDLGMKPSPISYYGKCSRTKDGTYKAYTITGPIVFIVSTMIVLLIVVAILGLDSIFKGIGRILIAAAFMIGILLGVFCRILVGSAAKLDDEKVYYSKIPFRWKEYELADIKEQTKNIKPFYHVTRGYVVPTSKGKLILPVASYKGGQEFLREFTQRIGQPMVDIRPELILSKHSDKAKRDEVIYGEFLNNIKKEEE